MKFDPEKELPAEKEKVIDTRYGKRHMFRSFHKMGDTHYVRIPRNHVIVLGIKPPFRIRYYEMGQRPNKELLIRVSSKPNESDINGPTQ